MAGIVNILTQAGSGLIARALAGDTITFTSVSFGDECYTGADIETARTTSSMKTGGGTGNITNGYITRKRYSGTIFTLTVTFDNATFTGTQTIIKEIGIFAKAGSSSPVLFGYLSMGDYGTDIVKPDVQSMVRQFDIPFSFGEQADTLKIVPNGFVSAQDTSTTAQAGKLIYADSDGKMPVDITGSAQKLDGHDSTYFAIATHTHDSATSTANGFMSAQDKSSLETLKGNVNQSLTTTSSPSFSGLTVNGIIRGAMFE